ncbi:MAG: ABC transporter permease [Bacteroidia bacterium]|nr:ABC transporter permease [Bacteroidia bacterium]
MFKTAYRFIRYDRPKSLGALAGVIISVFLVGQQAGIFIFLTNSMSSLVRNNSQYIWVVDNKTTNVSALSPLDVRIGREIASLPGVRNVHPIVVAGGSAKFENGASSGVNLIGSEGPDYAGGPWNQVLGDASVMTQEGAVITDFFDRKLLGEALPGDYFEVNGKRVYIAGQTRGVRSFSGAYVFTTIERARALGNFSSNEATAFLVEWDPALPQQQVIDTINQYVYGVRAWEGNAFAQATIGTVLGSSGIAFSFGTNIIFAFVVGFVIIGLMLYTMAVDRIKDYGTLKAIGATNGYVRRLILTQALMISVVGFLIASVLVEGFRNGIANVGTIFSFPLPLRLGFLGMTLFIAFTGSLFAIRRIVKLEPAQVFRT